MTNKEKDDLNNPNNKICNPPKFHIHGKERREYKKKLNSLKGSLKFYWEFHNEDKYSNELYGIPKVMSDADAKKRYEELNKEYEDLKELLERPYIQRYREERLGKLLDGI